MGGPIVDQALIERLERSFKLLAPRGQELVDRFYAKLFSENRPVRKLFPDDMTGQKKKLLASLIFVVQNLRKPDRMVGPLHEMGSRHVGYGTQAEHYPVVRDTLVAVMGEIAGDAWNDQLTADWTAALNVVAGIMLEGAKTAVAQSAQSVGSSR